MILTQGKPGLLGRGNIPLVDVFAQSVGNGYHCACIKHRLRVVEHPRHDGRIVEVVEPDGASVELDDAEVLTASANPHCRESLPSVGWRLPTQGIAAGAASVTGAVETWNRPASRQPISHMWAV